MRLYNNMPDLLSSLNSVILRFYSLFYLPGYLGDAHCSYQNTHPVAMRRAELTLLFLFIILKDFSPWARYHHVICVQLFNSSQLHTCRYIYTTVLTQTLCRGECQIQNDTSD